MSRPLDTLLDNLPALQAAYRDKPRHSVALERFTQATGTAMSLPEFKRTAPIVLSVYAALRKRLDTPVDKGANVVVPKRFEGWTVRQDEKGYARLYRKIGGKLRSVYVGKIWDEKVVREKLANKFL